MAPVTSEAPVTNECFWQQLWRQSWIGCLLQALFPGAVLFVALQCCTPHIVRFYPDCFHGRGRAEQAKLDTIITRKMYWLAVQAEPGLELFTLQGRSGVIQYGKRFCRKS